MWLEEHIWYSSLCQSNTEKRLWQQHAATLFVQRNPLCVFISSELWAGTRRQSALALFPLLTFLINPWPIESFHRGENVGFFPNWALSKNLCVFCMKSQDVMKRRYKQRGWVRLISQLLCWSFPVNESTKTWNDLWLWSLSFTGLALQLSFYSLWSVERLVPDL